MQFEPDGYKIELNEVASSELLPQRGFGLARGLSAKNWGTNWGTRRAASQKKASF
jgi:hypothetical protein